LGAGKSTAGCRRDFVKECRRFCHPAKPSAETLKAALSQWQSARSNAIGTLYELEKQIAGRQACRNQQSIDAIESVVANLTAESQTPLKKVSELQEYLDKDDVVSTSANSAKDIRPPYWAS